MTNLNIQSQPAKPFTFDCLQAMDLVIKIETAIAGKQHVIAMGIRSCIKQGVPAYKILREITEMARDNHSTMANMLGEKLLVTIINFE